MFSPLQKDAMPPLVTDIPFTKIHPYRNSKQRSHKPEDTTLMREARLHFCKRLEA
jgi:hypothetical protein